MTAYVWAISGYGFVVFFGIVLFKLMHMYSVLTIYTCKYCNLIISDCGMICFEDHRLVCDLRVCEEASWGTVRPAGVQKTESSAMLQNRSGNLYFN